MKNSALERIRFKNELRPATDKKRWINEVWFEAEAMRLAKVPPKDIATRLHKSETQISDYHNFFESVKDSVKWAYLRLGNYWAGEPMRNPLNIGVRAKEQRVKARRWVHRRLRYLRNEGGVLGSRGWQTEAWGRVYTYLAEATFSLAQACHAEDLPYHGGNTKKELRNEGYIGYQWWRGQRYPVDGHHVTNEATFRKAIENLARQPPFEEERKSRHEAWELAAGGKSEGEIAGVLTRNYPLLAKSYPNKRLSRAVVHGFLSDPAKAHADDGLRKKVSQARASAVKPLVRRMKAWRDENLLAVLRVLKDSKLRRRAILQKTGLPRSTTENALRSLGKTGLVGREEGHRGSYYLTTQGRLHLATINETKRQRVATIAA